MTGEMTPGLSVRATAAEEQKWEKDFQREKITRRVVVKEIAKGIRLSWKENHKAKAYCIEKYIAQTGQKPAEKQEVEHTVKPIRIFYVRPEEKKKSRIKIKRDSDS